MVLLAKHRLKVTEPAEKLPKYLRHCQVKEPTDKMTSTEHLSNPKVNFIVDQYILNVTLVIFVMLWLIEYQGGT